MSMRALTLDERIKRFWSYVDKTGECWVWTRSKVGSYGYGKMLWGDRGLLRAHRISWELTYGDIPDGLCVLHSCDNPPCVNPTHLFLGTLGDNHKDCFTKGRTEIGRPWKLDSTVVKDILDSIETGETRISVARRLGLNRDTVSLVSRGLVPYWVTETTLPSA